MPYRASVELGRRLDSFNTGFIDVVITVSPRVAINEVIDIITIARHTPVYRPRQTFKATFPLLTLFWLQIRITVIFTVDLAHGRCFIRCTVRTDDAIPLDELPCGAGLPGGVIAKIRVIVITRRRFQRHAVELLHRRKEHAGITLFVTFFQIARTRLGFLLLPVQTRADIAVTHFNRIQPLGGVLLHVIHGCGVSVAAFFRIIVLIFATAIPCHQL